MLGSPTPLPIVLSSFIGREGELTAVREVLDRSRLVTLTGVGGSGKTRLAVEVARTVEVAHRDGVAFVDLAPLSEPSLVPQAVAQALGLTESPGLILADVVVAG